jgi:hypothetical protein
MHQTAGLQCSSCLNLLLSSSRIALPELQLDLIAGLAIEYVRKSTGLCEPQLPEYKDPPVDYVRHPAVRCFRPFLDR